MTESCKCPICGKDATDTGNDIECDYCDVSLWKRTVDKDTDYIKRLKRAKLTPYEIEILINGHSAYKIKKIGVFKKTILDMVKRRLSRSMIANILNCPVYTVEETLAKWGYESAYDGWKKIADKSEEND